MAAPAEPPTRTSEITVFYIDYGNQETLPFSRLRPMDQPSLLALPKGKPEGAGLAQLCRLAHVKVRLPQRVPLENFHWSIVQLKLTSSSMWGRAKINL